MPVERGIIFNLLYQGLKFWYHENLTTIPTLQEPILSIGSNTGQYSHNVLFFKNWIMV